MESLEWLLGFIKNGASPKNVSNDAQAVAFRQQRNSLTWDGIWMMNEWEKVDGLEWAAAPVPTIGDKPAVWASSHNFVVTTQATQGPEQAGRLAGVHLLHLGALDRVGQVGPGPGPQQRAGVAGVRGADRAVDAGRPAAQRRLPADRCPASVTSRRPTYETAVNEVILGKKQPKAALDEAAKKADALLKANAAKYQA